MDSQPIVFKEPDSMPLADSDNSSANSQTLTNSSSLSSYNEKSSQNSQDSSDLTGMNLTVPAANCMKGFFYVDDPNSQETCQKSHLSKDVLVLVPIGSLTKLLEICRHPGCGDYVLPDNIELSNNG